MPPIGNKLIDENLAQKIETYQIEGQAGKRMLDLFEQFPDMKVSATASYGYPDGKEGEVEVHAWLERSDIPSNVYPPQKRARGTKVTLYTRIPGWTDRPIEHVSVLSPGFGYSVEYADGRQPETDEQRLAAVSLINETLDLIDLATKQSKLGTTALS